LVVGSSLEPDSYKVAGSLIPRPPWADKTSELPYFLAPLPIAPIEV